jgi:hypothetical protein
MLDRLAMQQANTPCDVGGDGRPQRQNVVSSRSPTQQGADVPSAVDTVVHDPVTPIMNDKAVPAETSVPDTSNRERLNVTLERWLELTVHRAVDRAANLQRFHQRVDR